MTSDSQSISVRGRWILNPDVKAHDFLILENDYIASFEGGGENSFSLHGTWYRNKNEKTIVCEFTSKKDWVNQTTTSNLSIKKFFEVSKFRDTYKRSDE